MVRVSTAAVALLEENRREQEVPESHGIRIFGEDDGEGGMNIRLAFIDDPEMEDQRLEENGTHFYVAPEVTERLEDTVIDVTEQDPPQLVLRRDEPSP